MGQSSSTPSGEEKAASVSLSKDLEAEIMQDFQNRVLKKEWDKFRTSVLVHRSERTQQMTAASEQLQAQRKQAEASRAPRMEAIDQKLDALNAQFDDTSVALEYDTDRVGDQYKVKENSAAELDSIPLPCLGPRAHVIDCMKKYKTDPRPCDAYVATLQKCVNQKILTTNEAQVKR